MSRLTVGAPARIVDPAGGDPLDASVISRPAAVEPGSVTASIRLRPKSARELTAGMSVQVEILGPEHDKAVLVPPAAVVRDGDTTVVMTLGARRQSSPQRSRAGCRRPATRWRSGKASRPGDKVLVRGQNGLPDGAAVTVGS